MTLEGIYRAWERAEKRFRELPPGSPLAEEALAAATQLWDWYERELGKAIGRGKLRPPESRRSPRARHGP
jgi:hypothetical protein